MDGMCPESWGGDILSVKKAKMSVPLQVHQLVSESSFKKGRIAFTALSAVVDKERSTMLLGVVRVVVVVVVAVVVVRVVVVRVADEGEVPDIFARPARDAQVSELVNEIANIMRLTITCRC